MLFLEPLLERLFCDFMLIFDQKVRFWSPPGHRQGSKFDPWGDHFGQNVDFSLPCFPGQALLEPTLRRPGGPRAPKGRPNGPKAPILLILGATWRPNGSKHRPKGRPKVDFSHILMSDWLHCSNVLTSLPKHQTKTFIFRRCSIRLSSPPRPNDDHQR